MFSSCYVFGNLLPSHKHSSTRVTLAVLTPTEDGWRCRSTARDCLQHDYVSCESLDVVTEWLECEMTRTYWTEDRDQVLDLLATTDDPSAPSAQAGVHLETFLFGDPNVSSAERSERVLRHLETGW